jgi:hypothetical protein
MHIFSAVNLDRRFDIGVRKKFKLGLAHLKKALVIVSMILDI